MVREVNIETKYKHPNTDDITWQIINYDAKSNAIKVEAFGYNLFFIGTLRKFKDIFKDV